MNLSGWTRIWIVTSALALSACGGTSAEEAYDHASTAIDAIDRIHTDMREMSDRIDELEGQVNDLDETKQDLESRVDSLEIELDRVGRQASNAEGAALSRR